MEAWRAYVEEAYRANWFTNFGALSRRLERVLTERWGFGETACVVASSATAALAAPLIARGVEGPVLIPAFTFRRPCRR
jgi:dTDP-4-amino-4,6-dideoxygalactose transaminase